MTDTQTMSAADSFLAWHFLPDDGRLRYGDREKVTVGETLTVAGPLILCEHGLHWSLRALDALQYAPGALACRVRVSGDILHDDDKGCSTERTVLAMDDATMLLHEYGCWCAEGTLGRERAAGREPDPRSWRAIEVKRLWLAGQATDAELNAAYDDAVAAAYSAAAASTAYSAAHYDAAYSAAAAAYSAAAASTARATRGVLNTELESRLTALLGL